MKPLKSILLKPAAARLSPVRGDGNKDVARLQEITTFGSNPGGLRAWTHVPDDLPAKAPLVVVLHGCSQHAADYDNGAGWSRLADEMGFIVLLPEQQRANNFNLCFNWFSPIDSRRDSGEALSIRQMIAWLAKAHGVDERRVYVTGLSAGGAMTSIMLATYPDVFAGGAIIAGLPFGAVASVSDAFSRMAGHGYPAEAELAALVRDSSSHEGPWPDISVWHGSADSTVSPTNADRIIAQWRSLHGVSPEFSEQSQSGTHIRRTWRNSASHAVLEQHIITGMGHGTPLDTRGSEACGKAAPYMLDVGICSTRAIAQSWGLTGSKQKQPVAAMTPSEPAARRQAAPSASRPRPAVKIVKGVGAIIEDALRAAGLMN